MFSLTTTMFYMLSAYIAFLIGSSEKLSIYLLLLVPVGFVSGYFLDRLNSVRKLWHENRLKIYRELVIRYVVFLFISAAFCIAGLLFATDWSFN